MNDTQNGLVIVNWKVTALVLILAQFVWGQYLGASIASSVGVGLLCVASWLALEVYRWEPNPTEELNR